MAITRFSVGVATVMLCGAVSLGSAKAQLIGNYGGQRADGTPISIGVSRFMGNTIISFVQVQANTSCRDGTTFDLNTFVAAEIALVTSKTVVLNYSNDNTYLSGTVVFDNSTQSVSGFFSDKLSKLATASAVPVKSTICSQASQPFAAVLAATAIFDPKLMTIGNGIVQ